MNWQHINPMVTAEELGQILPCPRRPHELDLSECRSVPDDGEVEKVVKGWEDDNGTA